MKYSIVFVFILFSNCAFACGSGLQKAKMARQLYVDTEMRQFVCASDSCSENAFADRLMFHRFEQVFRGHGLRVCLVEPALTAANSYTGVFAETGGNYRLQFISYGAGVKFEKNGRGVPLLKEYAITDHRDDYSSVSIYLWNQSHFIYSRDMQMR
ncbi:hypothetical protein [Paraburkholderia caledonica]|jgi:hypothetical protein|uniref:Uncharacterized protein n=1 Tax=Paraburkholderia caledonica TaxID=134536 RepID=A0ABU1L5G1_9BURK|nr:hypothetical protein [Paraburkholderia caledonica]MDR6378452.1 hypothetical protein [Paraburkholderia caledonica]